MDRVNRAFTSFIFHVHIAFIFQSIIVYLSCRYPSIKLLFYATVWTLIIQEIYYISELLKYYKKEWIDTKILQNISWASSVYILSFWIFRYIYHWKDNSPIWLEILAHGANSVIIALTVFMDSKISWSTLRWSYLYFSSYLIAAIVYTNVTESSIYPTNFFSFSDLPKLSISLLSVIFWPPIAIWLGLNLFKKRKLKDDDQYEMLDLI